MIKIFKRQVLAEFQKYAKPAIAGDAHWQIVSALTGHTLEWHEKHLF